MGAIPEYAGGEVIANKYVVDRPLGDGPNGRAYLADSGLGSPKLCVKILRTEVSARLLAAPDFFLKAGVATEIEHDNLVACVDVQEEMGRVYVARTHVEGPDFEEWARRDRREANYLARGLEILWQACQGLSALHERTRHLNIHPGNLFVTPLQAKLADWDPRTLGSMEMTPDPLPFRPQYAGYRAPEMAGGGSFLSYPSTDLFAVAGLLYRLVLDEHPADPARVQAAVRGLDGDLGAFLAKAMHPRPEERYQEASAFSDALWELTGPLQRLQEGRASRAGREERPRPRPADPVDAASTTLAMAPGGEATLFGAPGPAAPEPFKNDSFFGQMPDDARRVAARPPSPPRRDAPTPPSAGDRFGASPLEAPATGDTLFGSPSPRTAPAAGDTFFGGAGSNSRHAGAGGLEDPGTLFGAEAAPPPPPSRKAAARGAKPDPRRPAEAKPAPVTLSSLEKDVPDVSAESGAGGHTQFGFKGTGDNRTLYAEGDRAGQRKLVLALGTLGALVLALALGGLFVYLRSTAAPEVPSAGAEPADEAPAERDPAPDPRPAGDPATADAGTARPAEDGPPFPLDEAGDDAARAADADAGTSVAGGAASAAAASGQATPPPRASGSGSPGAAKGTPARLAELMAVVAARRWPDGAKSRLQVADELNDFGKVAEANVAYERAAAAADATEKQRIAALGGLAVTFYSMGMKPQASDAIARILEINPRNAFALKFREKLK